MQYKIKLYNGFTLIELLIVVAIIGILAAVAGANFIDALQRADAAACQQNLHTIHTALQSYRLDFNHFPPADGMADTKPQPDKTAWGCGPAANGYWSGISLLLVKYDYCSTNSLYCPALKRTYDQHIPAYSSCGHTDLAGKEVPQWRFLRYAYNSGAVDTGGYLGGENNIEKDWRGDVWLVRCLHLNVGTFDPDRKISFPFRIEASRDNPNATWYGEYELTVLGDIRLRKVQLRYR